MMKVGNTARSDTTGLFVGMMRTGTSSKYSTVLPFEKD